MSTPQLANKMPGLCSLSLSHDGIVCRIFSLVLFSRSFFPVPRFTLGEHKLRSKETLMTNIVINHQHCTFGQDRICELEWNRTKKSFFFLLSMATCLKVINGAGKLVND